MKRVYCCWELFLSLGIFVLWRGRSKFLHFFLQKPTSEDASFHHIDRGAPSNVYTLYTHTHAHTQTRTQTRTHSRTHTRTHSRTHTRTHTHTHTHSYVLLDPFKKNVKLKCWHVKDSHGSQLVQTLYYYI
jgi:hypothetical protein